MPLYYAVVEQRRHWYGWRTNKKVTIRMFADLTEAVFDADFCNRSCPAPSRIRWIVLSNEKL